MTPTTTGRWNQSWEPQKQEFPDTEIGRALNNLFNTMDRLAEAEHRARRDEQDARVQRLRQKGRLWWDEEDNNQDK